MNNLNNLVPKKSEKITSPEDAAKLVELVEDTKTIPSVLVKKDTKIEKEPVKETFETLEEMTGYLQNRCFPNDKLVAEKWKEYGHIYKNKVSDETDTHLYYYECPDCKFVLGPKEQEHFDNTGNMAGKSGWLTLCRICGYQFKKVVTGHC